MSNNSKPPSWLKRNVPLGPRTTIRIGGEAAYFCRVNQRERLVAAIRWARRQGLPHLVLGGGSNLLLPDVGFAGLVLSMEIRGRGVRRRGEAVLLELGAGEIWDEIVARAVANGWAGIECLSGIPGKVGAAPIQNIGAYGQELSRSLREVEALDLETLEFRRLKASECGLAYRDSRFKSRQPRRFIVTAVGLALKAGGAPTIRYPDLAARLPESATLAQAREAVLAVRRSKSMIIDDRDPNSRGCGSFFVNPILSQAEYEAFKKREPGTHPHYPSDEGRIKLSAAWLMDNAGFNKGFARGNVGLSRNHCLAIINRGNGTAAEVRRLVALIQEGVHRRFGIRLVPEPVML